MLLLILAPIYAQSLYRRVRMIAVRKPKQKLIKAGFQAHEREIVKLAVGLGFTIAYPHKEAHVLVESEEKIRVISIRAGFSTNFYSDVEESACILVKR